MKALPNDRLDVGAWLLIDLRHDRCMTEINRPAEKKLERCSLLPESVCKAFSVCVRVYQVQQCVPQSEHGGEEKRAGLAGL